MLAGQDQMKTYKLSDTRTRPFVEKESNDSTPLEVNVIIHNLYYRAFKLFHKF